MSRKAFTLVELLISAAIISVIILSLYSAFQTGILSYNKMDSAFKIYQNARILLYRMSRDIGNSFSYSPEEDSRFVGTKDQLECFSLIDNFEKAAVSSSVCRIKYSVSDFVLKRSCLCNLAAITAKENLQDSGEDLSSDVKEISFQYASLQNGSDKPYNWQDVWPAQNNSEQKKGRPAAVKIKLVLVERDKKQKEIGTLEFNKVIPLFGK